MKQKQTKEQRIQSALVVYGWIHGMCVMSIGIKLTQIMTNSTLVLLCIIIITGLDVFLLVPRLINPFMKLYMGDEK